MPKVEPPATVAVTGASGFVGSHVVRELLQRGYDVRAVVTDPTNEAKVEHLRRMGGKLTLRRGDLMTPGSYDEAFRGCEGIVHCAARVHEARQGAELLPSHLEGTNNVLASAMKAGSVKRFVHTSSEAAVFDPFKLQSSEVVVFSEADWSDACTPDVGGFYATGSMPISGAQTRTSRTLLTASRAFGPSGQNARRSGPSRRARRAPT